MGWRQVIFPLLIIDAASMGFSGLFVYSPTVGHGNLVASITASAGTDPFGNQYEPSISSYDGTAEVVRLINGNVDFEAPLGVPVGNLSGFLTGMRLGTTGGLPLWIGSNGSFANDIAIMSPSGDATGATDIARINGTYTSGTPSQLLVPGQYYISGTVSPPAGGTFRGSGQDNTVIHQVTTGLDGIDSFGQNSVKIADLTIAGPAAGTGNGIHLTGNASAAASHLTIEDVAINGFPGAVGILLDTVILSRITRCTVATCSNGYQMVNDFGPCTSLTFESCYAAGNSGTGYVFDAAQYCALTGCGSDNNPTGYGFFGCEGISLAGCGTEGFTATGWDFDNSKGCTLAGAVTFNGKTIAIRITDGSTRIGVLGATEISPAAGATAFLQVDAGCSAYVAGITHITADVLTGTVTNIDGSA